jgi:trans-aconitate 2-methyltransferase
VLAGPEEIVEWYRGTGLRPWLDALSNEEERTRFVREYSEAIAAEFPRRPDGRVLFPFKRLFVVAYRP